MEVAKRQLSLAPDAAEPDPAYRAVLQWVWSFSARARSTAEMDEQRSTKLERMRELLRLLGDPHARFSSLLVAGSKGKGSTVAMLAACLQAAGRHTGRYTSPHLINWRERATIDSEPISTDAVIALAEPIRDAVARMPAQLGELTTFDVGTAFAFLHFATQDVDIAVLEVGVGGRFDATNVVDPLVSVITPISYEHTATLGATLSAIAEHKAGILRRGRPGIVAPQPAEAQAVIERTARELGTELQLVGSDWWWTSQPGSTDQIRIDSHHVQPMSVTVPLLGDHQRDNATAAVAALHAMGGVPRAAIEAGLARVDWPGRLQVVRTAPWLVLDGAHNAASADVLRRALDQYFSAQRCTVVLGLTAGKDARGVLEALSPRIARLRVTRSRHERSADASDLLALAREKMPHVSVTIEPDVESAVEAALAESGPNDLVLVTGSLFLVGEVLVWWRRSPR